MLGKKEEGKDREERKGKNGRIIQADLRLRKKKGSQRVAHREIHGRPMYSGVVAAVSWFSVCACLCIRLTACVFNGTSEPLGKPIVFI